MEGFQAMEKNTTPRQRPGDQGRFGSELGLEYFCGPKNLRQMAGSLKTCFPENSLKSLVLFLKQVSTPIQNTTCTKIMKTRYEKVSFLSFSKPSYSELSFPAAIPRAGEVSPWQAAIRSSMTRRIIGSNGGV